MADYVLANPTFNVSDWLSELRLEDMQSLAGWEAAAVAIPM
jgi:type I restriction-modification system DNA methylase subunit